MNRCDPTLYDSLLISHTDIELIALFMRFLSGRINSYQGQRNRPPNPPVGGAQAWSGAPPIEYQPKTNIQVSTLSILIYCFMFRF